jgi:hypothetical protein
MINATGDRAMRQLAPFHRPWPDRSTVGFLIGAAAILAGCANPTVTPGPVASPTTALTATQPPPPTAPATAAPTAFAFERNPAPIVDGERYTQTIDPASFVDGVDNPFFPMIRGATFGFDGAEHVEVDVLPDRKEILGVSVTVVRDRVFEDGELIEDTLDWYVQDRQGNVWYFGEQTAEYENGEVSSTAGSWEAGKDGAVPGIVMLAEPHAGDEYRQEFYEGEAEDLAAIIAVSGTISVAAGSWDGADVLVTEEWTPLEPDVRERKTYARGFGVVEIRTIKGGDEVTTLTSATFPS